MDGIDDPHISPLSIWLQTNVRCIAAMNIIHNALNFFWSNATSIVANFDCPQPVKQLVLDTNSPWRISLREGMLNTVFNKGLNRQSWNLDAISTFICNDFPL